jgi:hypothetical protein
LGSHSGSHWEMLGTVLGNTGPDMTMGLGEALGTALGRHTHSGTGWVLHSVLPTVQRDS